MIKTARQLKDLIRNLSKKNAADAQILMRNYMMERFLERISLSSYRDKFILKGGMLVAAMVGLDARSTMDLDATVKGANVSVEDVENMMAEIIAVPIDDGVTFQVKSISEIMDEAEYPGIRVTMTTLFDGVRTPLKIDISTGDAITPKEVRYSFKLMLEDRSIDVWAYNLETVLAEKLETIITRTTTNTRMRDFTTSPSCNNSMAALWTRTFSMTRCWRQPTSAAPSAIWPRPPKSLMKWRTARSCRTCGRPIRKSSPMRPTLAGIRSWLRSASCSLVARARHEKSGHYCKVCGEYKANEKFSGKGHAAHICKTCAALPPEKQAEEMTLTRLVNLPWRLSKEQLSWLKKRMKDKRDAVRTLATEQYEIRFPPRIELDELEDDFEEDFDFYMDEETDIE